MKKARKNRNIYDFYITYENIYAMWLIIKKTCKNKKAIFYFSLNLNTNIYYIYSMLKSRLYKPGLYNTFLIFEPKPRLVMSQSITDKIVNHFVANYYLIPLLEKKLVDCNVATRKEKGSSYAMSLLKKYYNKLLINEKGKEIYCLKIDISKYLYSIDHNILLGMLEKNIYDKDIIALIKLIIHGTNKDYVNKNIQYFNTKFGVEIPFYNENKGLSIGAMSSQFLAIFYLNELYHIIKEELHCKYYIRYMDDFLIIDTDRKKLLNVWKRIRVELDKLKLRENKKSNLYRSSSGFTFLGYRYRVINGKLDVFYNKKTFRKITKKLDYLYNYDMVLYKRTLASYYGYFMPVSKLEGVDFKMKLIDKYDSYKKKYPSSIVFMKEGIFYKTFYDDAKVIWYLFDYKYVNDSVSFGNTPYDKVLARLNKLDIGYVVIDKDKEVIISSKDKENYDSYVSLAVRGYNKETRGLELLDKVKKVLDTHPEEYDKINNSLDEILITS